MKVLLIDDDQSGLTVRAKLLTLKGHEVLSALTGKGGLAILRAVAVDVVVVDYNLHGGLSGDALIGVLREVSPKVRLVLLSGQMEVPEATLAKVNAFVVKGTGVDKLLNAIEP